MATPIGVDTISSLSRRFILPEIADNVYADNVLFQRLYRSKKKSIQGGTQLEAPIMYSTFAAGGSYQGFDVLDISPSDTIKNAAWSWKQYYVPVSIDLLSVIRADSDYAVASLVATQWKQAEMQMAENLGTGLWSNGVYSSKDIDGIVGAVDDGTILATYGGINRSSNTWWKAQIDSTTTTTSLTALNALFGNCRSGGRAPTVIFSSQARYNNFWALNTSPQRFPVGPGLVDSNTAQAGFTSLMFNGVPWLTDSHIPTTTDNNGNNVNGGPFFLNEDYITYGQATKVDFYMEDFQVPYNQTVYTGKLLWAGNLLLNNVQRQGKFTALTA